MIVNKEDSDALFHCIEFEKIRSNIEKVLSALEEMRLIHINQYLNNEAYIWFKGDFETIKKQSNIILKVFKLYKVDRLQDLFTFYRVKFNKFSSDYNHTKYNGLYTIRISDAIYDGERTLDYFRCKLPD